MPSRPHTTGTVLTDSEYLAEQERVRVLRAPHSPLQWHSREPRPVEAIEWRAPLGMTSGVWLFMPMEDEAFLALPFWKQLLACFKQNGRCNRGFNVRARMAQRWLTIPLARRQRFIQWYLRANDEYPHGTFRQQRFSFLSQDYHRGSTAHNAETRTLPYDWQLECQCCRHSFALVVEEPPVATNQVYVYLRATRGYCPTCREAYGLCANCLGLLRNPNVSPEERAEVPEEYSHLCHNCWRSQAREVIGPNNLNPIIILAPKLKLDPKVIYEGVELEVECSGIDATSAAAEIRTVLERKAVVKRDGSLYDGFEICSLPMTIDEHRRYWANVFKHPRWLNIRADETPRAGLHIHASRKPLSKLQVARFIHFFTQPHNREFVYGMAGRRENSYCTYGESGQSMNVTARKLSGQYPVDKYDVVNLCHPDSIEVRAFQSTKDYHKLTGRLEFVLSGLVFSHMRDSKEVTWEQYMDWLCDAANRKAFPTAYLLSKLAIPNPSSAALRMFGQFWASLRTEQQVIYRDRLACRCRDCVDTNRQTEVEANYHPTLATVNARRIRRSPNHAPGEPPMPSHTPVTDLLTELHGPNFAPRPSSFQAPQQRGTYLRSSDHGISFSDLEALSPSPTPPSPGEEEFF